MGVAKTAPKVQKMGAWSQRTAGRSGGRQTAYMAKMLVDDLEPTPQHQNLPKQLKHDDDMGDTCELTAKTKAIVLEAGYWRRE